MRFCNLIPNCKDCSAKGICKDVFLDGVCAYGPEIEVLYRTTTRCFEFYGDVLGEWIRDVQLILANLVRKRMG